MRVLVTGATGYLGRAIVASCHRAGHETVSFARRAGASGLPGRTVDGDIRDAAAVAQAMQGCDAVCHAAALVSVWRPRQADFDEVNVGGLRAVLSAARQAGLRRIVYTSSFLALPPAGSSEPGRWNDYQRTKVTADLEASRAVEAGAPVVRLYPGVLFGPGVRTDGNLVGRSIADHLAGRLPGVIGADRTWSFAWVDAVADAHVAALERGRPGERYSLGGENRPQMAVYEITQRLTGRPLPRRIPAALAVAAAAVEELRARIGRHTPLLTVGTVEILQRDWPLDSTAAIRELGYQVMPLEQGIQTMLRALGSNDAEERVDR